MGSLKSQADHLLLKLWQGVSNIEAHAFTLEFAGSKCNILVHLNPNNSEIRVLCFLMIFFLKLIQAQVSSFEQHLINLTTTKTGTLVLLYSSRGLTFCIHDTSVSLILLLQSLLVPQSCSNSGINL